MDKTLKIVAEGKVSLKVDTVKFNFNIITRDSQYEKTLIENTQQFNNLKNGLKTLNLNELITSRLSVDTEYANAKNNKEEYIRTLKGYVCTHSCEVKTNFDNDLISKIINIVISSLTQPDFNLEFSSSKTDTAQKKAMELACKNANTNAKILAKASGVELCKLVKIEYMPSRNNFASPMVYNDTAMLSRSVSLDIAPTDVSITEKVIIEWEIA